MIGAGRTHGRIATYMVGCRCSDCRAASAARRRRYRIAKAENEGREYGHRTCDWVTEYRLGRVS